MYKTKDVLNVPMQPNDADAATIGDYLVKLLVTLARRRRFLVNAHLVILIGKMRFILLWLNLELFLVGMVRGRKPRT